MMSTITCEDLSGVFEVLLFGKNFDTYNRMIEKNKPYLFVGRRQMREGGELSMFADSCFELSDDPSLLSAIRNDRGYQTALRERDGAQIARQTQVPQAQPQTESSSPAKTQTKPVLNSESGEQILRIHYHGRPDSKGFNRLLNFLAYFHGNIPVEVVFESDKSIIRLDDICRIQPDEAVFAKLAELGGEDNIEMI